MSTSWWTSLVLVAGLTAACRHVAPEPLSAEWTADRVSARSLADPGLREFLTSQGGGTPDPWPQAQWDLRGLTFAAIYFSPELRVARAAADVADAGVGAAAQRPNPTLSFAPQRVARPESGVSPWIAVVQLDWPIETAGKRAHRRDAAQARATAADLAVHTAAWRVRSCVAAAAVAVSAADTRRSLIERMLALRRHKLDLLDRRRAVGEIAELIAAPARIAVTQASVDLAAAERQRAEARAALAAALGTPPSALDAIEIRYALDAPSDADVLDTAGARRAALLSRSDVLALLAEYDAAEQELRLELAKQYPDLHVGPSYEYDQSVDKWGLVVAIELPLMNRNEGGIDEAVARRGEVAARFEALQSQVIDEVAASSVALDSARREVVSARELLAQAESGEARAQRALEAGAADRIALIDAQLDAQLAAGAVLDARERAHRAAFDLERAIEVPADGVSPEVALRAAPSGPPR
jgi:outer membrane protein, heavy metal efflux system